MKSIVVLIFALGLTLSFCVNRTPHSDERNGEASDYGAFNQRPESSSGDSSVKRIAVSHIIPYDVFDVGTNKKNPVDRNVVPIAFSIKERNLYLPDRLNKRIITYNLNTSSVTDVHTTKITPDFIRLQENTFFLSSWDKRLEILSEKSSTTPYQLMDNRFALNKGHLIYRNQGYFYDHSERFALDETKFIYNWYDFYYSDQNDIVLWFELDEDNQSVKYYRIQRGDLDAKYKDRPASFKIGMGNFMDGLRVYPHSKEITFVILTSTESPERIEILKLDIFDNKIKERKSVFLNLPEEIILGEFVAEYNNGVIHYYDQMASVLYFMVNSNTGMHLYQFHI